jgi:hypothetical protein
MIAATQRLTKPIYFAQAANDYSVGPTQTLPGVAAEAGKIVASRIFRALGVNANEGHLLESRGPVVWAAEIRHFLERHL